MLTVSSQNFPDSPPFTNLLPVDPVPPTPSGTPSNEKIEYIKPTKGQQDAKERQTDDRKERMSQSKIPKAAVLTPRPVSATPANTPNVAATKTKGGRAAELKSATDNKVAQSPSPGKKKRGKEIKIFQDPPKQTTQNGPAKSTGKFAGRTILSRTLLGIETEVCMSDCVVKISLLPSSQRSQAQRPQASSSASRIFTFPQVTPRSGSSSPFSSSPFTELAQQGESATWTIYLYSYEDLWGQRRQC